MVSYGMNQVLPLSLRPPAPDAHLRMFDLSWYSTPTASLSMGVLPPFVRWKMYSWHELR